MEAYDICSHILENVLWEKLKLEIMFKEVEGKVNSIGVDYCFKIPLITQKHDTSKPIRGKKLVRQEYEIQKPVKDK
jgi:hypothetical protein